jgi:hypothetical protein
MTWRAGRRLRLDLDHTFERMRVREGRLYTAGISYLAATLSISSRASLRCVVQHVDQERSSELYTVEVSEREQRLLSEVLFSYELNPRTVLYLGSSDGRAAGPAQSLTLSDRSVFLKLGYAWLL